MTLCTSEWNGSFEFFTMNHILDIISNYFFIVQLVEHKEHRNFRFYYANLLAQKLNSIVERQYYIRVTDLLLYARCWGYPIKYF